MRPRALESLLEDARFEFYMVRSLASEWRAVADHTAATFIATESDPLSALTYALTGGLTGPIVVLLPRRLLREADDLRAAGALACVPLPVSPEHRDSLIKRLRTRHRPARVDSTLRLLLDPITRTVRYRGRSVDLSPQEFALLYVLSRQSGRPVPADDLLRRVWRNAALATRQRLDVCIYQVRRKLGALGLAAAITTVRGYGYALNAVKPRRRRQG